MGFLYGDESGRIGPNGSGGSPGLLSRPRHGFESRWGYQFSSKDSGAISRGFILGRSPTLVPPRHHLSVPPFHNSSGVRQARGDGLSLKPLIPANVSTPVSSSKARGILREAPWRRESDPGSDPRSSGATVAGASLLPFLSRILYDGLMLFCRHER